MTWELIVALVSLVIAIASIVLVLTNRPDKARSGQQASPVVREAAPVDEPVDEVPNVTEEVETSERSTSVGVVINPTKVDDMEAFKSMVEERVAQAALGEIIWIETSVEDPGVSQAREAVERGAGVVLAVGGDGTVRAAAEGMAQSGVPLGIVPQGTGNLLARNLGIPVNNISEAVELALTGRDTTIDIGFLSAVPLTELEKMSLEEGMEEVHSGEHAFAVVAGLGFDAAMVGDADSGLKDKFGWMAYGASAMKNMAAEKIHAKLGIGNAPAREIEARSIMFANCGKLPGGFVLTRDARVDDGWLDIGILDTKAGIVGWGDFARRMTLKAVGIHNDGLPTTGDIEFHRAKTVEVVTEKPEWIQVDGDVLGFASHVEVRLVPNGLLVRA